MYSVVCTSLHIIAFDVISLYLFSNNPQPLPIIWLVTSTSYTILFHTAKLIVAHTLPLTTFLRRHRLIRRFNVGQYNNGYKDAVVRQIHWLRCLTMANGVVIGLALHSVMPRSYRISLNLTLVNPTVLN